MGCVASGQTAANSPGLPSTNSTCVEEDPVKVAALVDMGVSEKIAREALRACDHDLEKAAQDATERTAAEATKCFQDAQQILVEVQADLTALEAKTSGASNARELARLADAVTRASCTLDEIRVTGNSDLRNARREELVRCDNLEERMQALRVAATKQVVGDTGHAEVCEEIPGPSNEVEQQLPPAEIEHAVDVTMDSGASSAIGKGEPLTSSPAVAMPTTLSAVASATSQEAAKVVTSSTGSAAPAMPPGPSRPTGPLPTDMRIAGAECMRLAGNTAFKAGDFEVAAARYREALTLDGEDTAILSNLAAAELRLGHFAAAAEHASAADRFSGGFSAKALFRKGQALQGLGQFGEASGAFEAAVALEPSDQVTKRCLEECKAASARAVSPPAH